MAPKIFESPVDAQAEFAWRRHSSCSAETAGGALSPQPANANHNGRDDRPIPNYKFANQHFLKELTKGMSSRRRKTRISFRYIVFRLPRIALRLQLLSRSSRGREKIKDETLSRKTTLISFTSFWLERHGHRPRFDHFTSGASGWRQRDHFRALAAAFMHT